jgi:hypothetical protein
MNEGLKGLILRTFYYRLHLAWFMLSRPFLVFVAAHHGFRGACLGSVFIAAHLALDKAYFPSW